MCACVSATLHSHYSLLQLHYTIQIRFCMSFRERSLGFPRFATPYRPYADDACLSGRRTMCAAVETSVVNC